MNPLRWMAAAALIGFTTTLAQLALFRELSLLFYGHEIFLGFSLAVWVGGTAWGAAWIFPRLPKAWQAPSEKKSSYFCLLALAALFATLWGVTHVPREPGALLGLLPMLFWVSVLTLPVSAAGGLWYASLLAGVKKNVAGLPADTASPGNPAQLWTGEAWGAAAAGLLYTGILAFHWNTWSTAFGLAGLCLFFLCLGTPARKTRLALLLLASAALVAALNPAAADLSNLPAAPAPGPGKKIFSQATAQGTISLVANHGMFSVFLQNRLAYAFPWPEQNEPPALLPRLAKSPFHQVALVGDNPETIALARKQPESPEVWSITADAQAHAALVHYLPQPWQRIFADEHLHPVFDDPRRFLAKTALRFDAILFCLPLPETLALNRFYTREFIGLLARRLTPDGVVVYTLPFSPNLQLPAELDIFQALWENLNAFFPGTTLLTGDQLYFLASPSPALAALRVADLQNRERLSPGRARMLTLRQIPLIFDESRRSALLKILKSRPQVANTDAHPLAVHYYLRWWLAQQPLPVLLLSALGALLLPLALVRQWRQSPPGRVSGLLAWAGGLGLATEWLVIMAFQYTFGNIWEQIGLLFAAFMLGLGTGGWLGRLPHRFWKKTWLYFMVLACLCAGGGFLVSWIRRPAIAFLILLSAGLCVGTLYAVLQRQAKAPEALRGWSADLWGSAGSALITNALLVPLAGVWAGTILAGGALLYFFSGQITSRPAQKPGP